MGKSQWPYALGICVVCEEERPLKAKDMCTLHYHRQWRNGDPLARKAVPADEHVDAARELLELGRNPGFVGFAAMRNLKIASLSKAFDRSGAPDKNEIRRRLLLIDNPLWPLSRGRSHSPGQLAGTT